MRGLLLSALALLLALPGPVDAHKEHKEETERRRSAVAAEEADTAAASTPGPPSDARPAAPGHADLGEAIRKETPPPTRSRLLDWLGRLHPIIVHFPMAFFPAALFTAIVGRRRSAFAKPVQFLVVAGGAIAPIAAILGWFNGGLTFSDVDPLLGVHRWLGTGIGLGGLALAIWAWKAPEDDRSPAMLWSLAGITAAIFIQGWYGGALVHGIDHLNW
jgi:uncharacterized membrane protein